MRRLLIIMLLIIAALVYGILGRDAEPADALAASNMPVQLADVQTININKEPEANAASYSYSVKFVCGYQDDVALERAVVQPGIYATEINIYNYSYTPVGGINVLKNILPLVINGDPIGREPKYVKIEAVDGLTLPPETATMDDCYRIGELLYGSPPPDPMPLTIGYLEVVTSIDVRVEVVYTTANFDNQVVSMDVEEIEARMK